jgi:L-threonylcarbamoyladenylate synthase
MTENTMTTVPATNLGIIDAARSLREGELVAFPTETVYGLGAIANNHVAVARIFEAKGRPSFNPLIVHVASLEMAARLGTFTAAAEKLAEAFWPGALTLVVERAPDCAASELVSAGLPSIALRMPAHNVARDLIAATGVPLAAPSANPSEGLSPTRADHVAQGLCDKIAMILDGGPCPLGLESTVCGCFGDEVIQLRPGAIPREEIEKVVGPLSDRVLDAKHSPGLLARHYAPRARLRLDAKDVRQGEALLAFGPKVPECNAAMLNLSASGDLLEAAANLFAYLRELDASGATAIAVMPIPTIGLGEAINDRLSRAAAAA